MNDKTLVQVVYDGECPFCSAYGKMLRLQSSYDVELINAREKHPLVSQILAKGLDLDEGMVVKLDDNVFHGAEAMNKLALMSSKSGLIRRFSNWAFANKSRSDFLYPILRFGRNLSLRLLGFKKINH